MSKTIRALKRTVQTGAKTAIRAEKALERGVRGAAKSVRKGARSIIGIPKKGRSTPKKIEVMANNQPRRKRSGRGPNKGGFQPTFRNSKEGVIVKNREMIGTVTGYNAWTMQFAQAISPQNVIMMPWLASFAKKFDKYRLKSLSVHFTTRLGTAVTGSAVQGATQFGIVYDANDPAPTSYTAMMDMPYAVEKVAHSNNVVHFHPKCALFTEYFISHSSGDADLLSPADVYFSVYGFPATTNGIGNLWVEYEVELALPRVEASSVFAGHCQAFSYVASGSLAVSGFANNCRSAGTSLCVVVQGSSTELDFYFAQPGRYSVVATMSIVANRTTTAAMACAWASSGSSYPLLTAADRAQDTTTKLTNQFSFEKLDNGGATFLNNQIVTGLSNADLTYILTPGTLGSENVYLDISVMCWGNSNIGSTKIFQSVRKPDPQQVENDLYDRLVQRLKYVDSKNEVENSVSSSSSSSDTPRPPKLLVDQEELDYQLLKKIEQTPRISVPSGSNKRKV